MDLLLTYCGLKQLTNIISKMGDWLSNARSILRPEAGASDGAEPFDELSIDASTAAQWAEQIENKGYCTVAMSKVTRQFLMQIRNNNSIDWTPAYAGGLPHKDAGVEQHEPKVNQSLKQLIRALRPDLPPADLNPKAFQLRQPPKGESPETWHTDTGNNKVVILSTLKGQGTLFYDMDKTSGVFAPTGTPRGIEQVGKISNEDVHEAPQSQFLIFATRAIANESVKALIHCSPPSTNGRTTFLARWY